MVGLLTAVECALAGHEVTVVEREELPSRAATSFDRHRVLRALHPADAGSTASAVRAHHRWIELERILSSRFYNRVGALTVLAREQLPDALTALWNSGAQARVLDAAALANAYPYLRFGGTSAVLEAKAGVLLADRVLAAGVGWLRSQPTVRLLTGRAVARVDPERTRLHLADGENVRADAIVVAAGPWSQRLVPPAHAGELRLNRQSVLYCEVPARSASDWSAAPAIPALGAGAWLVPPVSGTPLKLSSATACRTVDDVTDHATAPEWRAHLTAVFAEFIPGFDAGWITESQDCYYLAHPRGTGRAAIALGERTVAFTACGGGSFKFAPLIARSLMGNLTGRAVGRVPDPAAHVGPLDPLRAHVPFAHP